jgi:hypothetical protein
MRKKRLVALAVPTALLVAGGLGVWDVHRRAVLVIERHEREIAVRSAQLRALPTARPVVLGEPEDGNAWELYRQAFAGLQQMTSNEADAIPELSSVREDDTPLDEDAISAIVAKYGPELDFLRRAVCRREVDPDAEEDGSLTSHLAASDSIRAMKFMAGAARHYHRRGDDQEAMELALVGLAMAQDLSRGASLVGVAYQSVGESIACYTAYDVLGGHNLGERQLEGLAKRLDGLLAGRPSFVDALPREELFVRSILLRSARGELPLASPAWRQLWSESILAAQALHSVGVYFGAARGWADLSPYDRIEAAAVLTEQASRRGNPGVESVLGSLKNMARRDATSLMEIRLLRLAVGIAWFEAERGRPPGSLAELVPRHVPVVETCPLSGMPLGYVSGRVWSPGRDRRDDGGVLDPVCGYDPDHDQGDVVWFMKRR